MKTPSSSAPAPWPVVALFALIVANATAASVAADELYRWTEADGSITFSPGPPPAGIAFERVEAAGRTAAGTTVTPDAEPNTAAQAPPANVAPPELNYAPPPLGMARVPPSVEGRASAPSAPATSTAIGSADPRSMRNDTANRRDEQCRELEKRVISLERRLATPLSADDMDNTVLYMARYQQNVDRHCRG